MIRDIGTDLSHGFGKAVWTSTAWRSLALDWVDGHLATAGISRTGGIADARVRLWSAVFSVPTTGGPVWFKAAGPSTSSEIRLYPLVHQFAPDHILAPIAIDLARRWILLPDGGQPLSDRVAGTELLEAMVRLLPRYGQLQRDLAPHLDLLLARGAPDLRPVGMPPHFEWARQAVGRYVERHGSRAEHAAYQRLGGMGDAFAVWCDQLNATPIGPSLDHGDLHPANILVPDPGLVTRATFFDWGLSAVAHPFTSLLMALRMLQSHLQVHHDAPEIERLRDAYLEVFTDLAPRSELIAAVELACQVGKVSRAWTWISLAGDAGSGTTGRRRQVLRWLSFLLDDSYLGRVPRQ